MLRVHALGLIAMGSVMSVTVILALLASAFMFGTFPLAASLGGLYASRLILGAVRGFLWPVLFAEVAEHGPPERRGSQFAVFWLYFGFGQLFSPALGGWLGGEIPLPAPLSPRGGPRP